MELDFFSLECNEVPISEFWHVYGFDMALGSLSFNAQCCVPALLENSMVWQLDRDGNGNPLQYSCQEGPIDGGAW